MALVVYRWMGCSAPNLREQVELTLFSIIQLGIWDYMMSRGAKKLQSSFIDSGTDKKSKWIVVFTFLISLGANTAQAWPDTNGYSKYGYPVPHQRYFVLYPFTHALLSHLYVVGDEFAKFLASFVLCVQKGLVNEDKLSRAELLIGHYGMSEEGISKAKEYIYYFFK